MYNLYDLFDNALYLVFLMAKLMECYYFRACFECVSLLLLFARNMTIAFKMKTTTTNITLVRKIRG